MPNFMVSFQPPNSSENTANPSELLAPLNIPSESVIAGMTLPMLLGLVGGKAIAEGLQSLGQASEEIFRGDRLPLLHFPVEPTTDPQESCTE
jgi:hypothetical protein